MHILHILQMQVQSSKQGRVLAYWNGVFFAHSNVLWNCGVDCSWGFGQIIRKMKKHHLRHHQADCKKSRGGWTVCVQKYNRQYSLSSLSLIWNCVLKCLQCVDLQFDTFFYPNIKWFVIKDGKIQKSFCDLYFEYSKGLFLNFSCPSIDLWPLLIFFFRKV